MTKDATAGNARDLLVTAGDFFLDLIFYDLDRLPELGEELKTEQFAFSPGGGAAITAAAAARLGRPAALVTVWGDSPLDRAARSLLDELGVGCNWTRVEPNSMSGLSVAVSTRADRYFLTYPGANRLVESFLLSAPCREKISQAGHVHFALTPTDWAPFCHLVTQLQSAEVTVSWDLGWDPAAISSAGFRRLWGLLDVLFLNEMEALRYTGAQDVGQAIEKLRTPRNLVVVKLGSRGAIAAGQGAHIFDVPAIQIPALETTGAGDAFNGGFLNAWMEGAELAACLQAGNVCGGLSTRAAGGVTSLPSLEEYQRVYREAF